MKEKRTILGYIKHPISGKPEIAFPEVRAWLKEIGNVVARPAAAAFPDSGTVFLHARAAFDSNPLPDHYGIFECQQSGRPGSAAWQVFRTDDSICQVFPMSSPLTRPLDLYAEVETGNFGRFANAFCGKGRFFLLARDGWLVGPYSMKNGRATAATERTRTWKDTTIDLLQAGESDFSFISERSLSAGITFPPTLQDAIKRILKLISKKGHCSFLSRQHITDLAQEMSNLSAENELAWFSDGMNELLPAFYRALQSGDELVHELLGNEMIGDLLDEKWRNAHLEKLEHQNAELKSAEEVLQKTKAAQALLVQFNVMLSQENKAIQDSIDEQKVAAKDALQAEIMRLSAEPAQIAVLASLLSRQPMAPPLQTSGISPWTEIVAPPLSRAAASEDSIVPRLLEAGLSVRCAHDVATIAVAAFIAGQSVSIKSPMAALFGEALLLGCGHAKFWACEVPAGLLEAIPCPIENIDGKLGLLFHGANRSDYNLVLAAFRLQLLKQCVGRTPPRIEAVLALDVTEALIVEQPIPIGPCVMPEFLYFAETPKQPMIKSTPTRSFVAIEPVNQHEFDEMFPQSLDFFQNSFLLFMARRYCAALKATGCEPRRVKELFLKYWLLPRASRAEIAEVLKGEPDLCQSDSGLADMLSKCIDE